MIFVLHDRNFTQVCYFKNSDTIQKTWPTYFVILYIFVNNFISFKNTDNFYFYNVIKISENK